MSSLHLKFRHEMSDSGSHRIVETVSNTIGPWALYESPSFIHIDGRTFSALTGYFGGLDKSIPPIETVFEMLTHETEHGEAQEERKSKSLNPKLIWDLETTSLKEFTHGR